jgi:hypothetical protein
LRKDKQVSRIHKLSGHTRKWNTQGHQRDIERERARRARHRQPGEWARAWTLGNETVGEKAGK